MNTWTTLLTPTELEKTFAAKPAKWKPAGKKPVEMRTPSGEIKRFDSATEAARVTNVHSTSINKRCQSGKPDRQGNHYRYI